MMVLNVYKHKWLERTTWRNVIFRLEVTEYCQWRSLKKIRKDGGNYKENNEIGSKKPQRKEENLSKLLITNVSDTLNAYPAKVFTGGEHLNSRKNVSDNADVLADSFMSPQKVPSEN